MASQRRERPNPGSKLSWSKAANDLEAATLPPGGKGALKIPTEIVATLAQRRGSPWAMFFGALQ